MASRARLPGSPASIAILILSFFQGRASVTEPVSVSGAVLASVAQGRYAASCSPSPTAARDTVWPGLLSGSGTPPLETTGFALAPGQSRPLYAPQGWSGRFWGRSDCTFDASGKGSYTTGDCGSGEVECRGAGASPPATLAEFTLDGDGGKDFYDVSLVDGYNLPMLVQPAAAGCPDTGCLVDLNERCPDELRADGGRACHIAFSPNFGL
ncbi:Thaumatin-like protein 1 [Zea mays]|uniref:Thaumatin-like protein 1 n=1 Tax=Zea mays TaxID=4577 RepID=A0A1D6E0G6_MAIZE|nr:Thaumatin-like protein 1 [Zea mays]